MNALDSRTIKTILVAGIAYAATKYAIPDQFTSPVVKSAIADVVVYAGLGFAAWYRKNARVHVKQWWGAK